MGASPLFFFFKKAKFQNQVCARTSTTGLQTRLSVLSHNLLKHSPLPSLVFPFPFSGVFIHPFKIHLKALLSSTDSLQLKMSQTGYDPNNPPCSHPGSVAPGYAPGYPHSGASSTWISWNGPAARCCCSREAWNEEDCLHGLDATKSRSKACKDGAKACL